MLVMVWTTDAVLAMVLIEDVLTSLVMIELSWYMCPSNWNTTAFAIETRTDNGNHNCDTRMPTPVISRVPLNARDNTINTAAVGIITPRNTVYNFITTL